MSCDSYQDPTVDKSPWPWDASTAIPEADANRYFSEHFIVPKLHAHQKVVLVPGLFGNRTDSWTDGFLTDKMQMYWEWAQSDPRVAGFMGYHYNSRTAYPGCLGDRPGNCSHKSSGSGLTSCCYKYGAVAYPQLNAVLARIGRTIGRNSAAVAPH